MTVEFNQFDLHPALVQAVADLGYETPTPIQQAIIPLMMSGTDVIAQSETGSGKTAAFALPMLNNMETGNRHVKFLVLAPTRELAMQVADAVESYGKHKGVRVLAVYGGASYGKQKSRLRSGVDVVVGTPGRMLDLIKQKSLDLSRVNTVVLDEADEMLSMGFIEDIESILKNTPDERQTTLFSATIPKGIQKLAQRYLTDPELVKIKSKQMTVKSIEQRYYLVNGRDKLAVLTRLFEVEDITSALIFTRTRISTAELANELSVRGFPAEALSGDLSQDARIRVLDRFRQKQIKVLVATDVAARGLDIDDISHVFNYDLPTDPEVYVHRVGRTGRAGKDGIAISLVSPGERFRIKKITSYTRQDISKAEVPGKKEIIKMRDEQLIEQMHVWLRRDRAKREQEMIADLVAEGYDPIQLAAVALKLARAEEKQRPIAEVGEVRESRGRKRERRDRRSNGNGHRSRKNGRPKRQHNDEGMVSLTFKKGKSHGVRPNDVVGTIAFHADIPGYTIGKIKIQDKRTMVDVPGEYVSKVLSKNGDYKIHEHAINIKLA